jgi:hypothetical protein
MAGQLGQTSRNSRKKIQPLNWAEAANAPALKGMVSFLDIKPEDIRNGQRSDTPSRLPELVPAYSSVVESPSEDMERVAVIESLPMGVLLPSDGSDFIALTFDTTHHDGEYRPIIESLPVGESLSVDAAGGMDESTSAESRIEVEPTPRRIERGVLLGAIPSQNRTIRKCRLSQDGHSTGEELIYRILWEEGRPEVASNPLGPRLVRIGYAELAAKARMHKANVRLNLASLAAKMAIEQNGDFISREMVAKSYRVLSYKEILERRRQAGLEYVIRHKNVVFVTANGSPISLPGLPLPKKRKRTEAEQNVHPIRSSRPVSVSPTDSDTRIALVSESGSEFDRTTVSKALNQFWTVDDAATEQLIKACRKVRPDAEAEEIAFFVDEKLQIARANRNITNPTGLILATVPQCFSGHSFDEFRRRRQERSKLLAEEEERKNREFAEMTRWLRRSAEAILANPASTEKQRARAEKDLIDLQRVE